MSFSSDKPDRYRWQPQLEEFATHLDAINEPSEHEDIFYEYMSGALIWRDEFNQDTPSDVIQALRMVWAYRTSLMLGKPRIELEHFWERSQSLFPNWIGFRAERREPSKRLLKIYRHGHIGLLRCLREMDEEIDVDP